jgi:hypothetical protein
MSIGSATPLRRSLLRYSHRDALLVALAFLHGAVLTTRPAAPIVALAMWWCANTVAHHFIHTPFFRQRWLNRSMALYMSVLLGLPQTLWRDRHLAHHAGVAWRPQLTRSILVEVLLVLTTWAALLATNPAYFLAAYFPGLGLGLCLCWLHGYYEHARGTTSHYGRVYNMLFFNDGYHVEHHAGGGVHWTQLPKRVVPGAQVSRWPAILRWLHAFSLVSLERLALHSATLQRFVLDRHERAFRRLLKCVAEPQRVAIVGGALFPRTALLLGKLLPRADLVVIDADAEHIRLARPLAPRNVEFTCDWYDSALHSRFDLVVIPLGFVGDRADLYRRPPARSVMIHDWIWRRRGTSVVVSVLLLKRLNLVTRHENNEFARGAPAGQRLDPHKI